MESRTEKLGDIADITTGKTPSKRIENAYGNVIKFLTPRDFSGRFSVTTERMLSDQGYQAVYNQIVSGPSVSVTCIGSDMGKVIYNRESVVTNQQVNTLSNFKSNVDPLFLYYLLSTKKQELLSYGAENGSTMPIITKSMFSKLEIKLPSVKVQRKLVACLSLLDDKIELNQQINKNLLQMMENCYRKMLKNAIYNHQSKQSNILTVADNIITGKTPSTKNPGYYGGDTPFITIPDMQGNVFVTVTKKRLTQSGTSVQKNKEIPALSLNVSCIGTVGLVTINPTVAHTNQQINSVIVSKDKLWELFFELRSLKGVMENMASGGTTILNMNKAIFSKLQINLLSPAIRKQFNAYANPIFEQILINDEQNHKLAKVRDLLLRKLLAGEINISFIEEAIKNA